MNKKPDKPQRKVLGKGLSALLANKPAAARQAPAAEPIGWCPSQPRSDRPNRPESPPTPHYLRPGTPAGTS